MKVLDSSFEYEIEEGKVAPKHKLIRKKRRSFLEQTLQAEEEPVHLDPTRNT